MARKIVFTVLAVGLLLGLGTVPAWASPYQPLRQEDACTTVDNTVDSITSVIPGTTLFSDFIGGVAGNLCENPTDPMGAVTGEIGDQFSEAWESGFGKVVAWLVDGMGQLLMMAMSWWIRLPNPDLENMTALQAISEYTFEIQLILLTASIIFVCVRMAQARRQARAGEAEETFRVLVRTVFAASLYSTVIAVLTKAGDAFALWVVNETSNNDPNGAVNSMVALSTASVVSPGLIFIVAIVGLLGALMQAILLVVRQAMLIVAVAALPVAASAGGTGVGRQTYQKITAWIIAFLLYKPVAALAYGIAFLAATGGSEDFYQVLLGIILLCSTAAILPALMRLITPAVAAVGSGGSGAGALGGAIAAGAAVATMGKSLAAGKAVQGAGASGAFTGGRGGGGVALAGGSGGRGGGGRGGGGSSSTTRQQQQPGPTRSGRGRESGARTQSGKNAGTPTTTSTASTRPADGTRTPGQQGRGDMGRHTIRQ